jgi:hypothetical protein
MNELKFLKFIILILEEHKQMKQDEMSLRFHPEYFEKFKDNPFDDWGKICLTLDEAKDRYQKLLDKAEKFLEDLKGDEK